jgi:hypothetical protein
MTHALSMNLPSSSVSLDALTMLLVRLSRFGTSNGNPGRTLNGTRQADFSFPKSVPELQFPKFDISMGKRE